MKRKSIISITAILLAIFALQFECLAQVNEITVDFFEPPPGVIDVGSLTTMLRLTNNTASPLDIYIHGEVSLYPASDPSNLIAWGESGVFNLPPGLPHFVTLSDVEPYEYHFVYPDPIYEQTVTVTNSIPAGIYQYCARFYNATTGTELSNTYACSEAIDATNASPPSLVLPIDDEIVYDLPNFSWLPSIPAPSTGESINYKLRIVELLPGQTKIDGISINPAFFEIIIPNLLNYNYDLSNPLLIDGNEYAWQVQSLLSDGITPYGDNYGKSEVWSFTKEISFLPPIFPVDSIIEEEVSHIAIRFTLVEPIGYAETMPDEPLALRAVAEDLHALIFTCNCGDSLTREVDTVSSPLQIRWDIIGGSGGFIQKNDLASMSSTFGEQVLYMPSIEPDSTYLVSIKLTAFHADTNIKPVSHNAAECFLDLNMKRVIQENSDEVYTEFEFTYPPTIVDLLKYDITLNNPPPVYNTMPEELEGDCKIQKVWQNKTPIMVSVNSIPDTILINDQVVLTADAFDLDKLEIKLDTTGPNYCSNLSDTLILPDHLTYTWYASNGSFPRGNTGKNVVWQAPVDTVECDINLIVSNGDFWDDIMSNLFVGKIKPCTYDVRLTDLNPDWIPDATQKVNITPSIQFFNGITWEPCLAKRIITLRLEEVSREPGVCMNYPPVQLQPGASLPAQHPPDLFFMRSDNETKWVLHGFTPINVECPNDIIIPGDNSPANHAHYLTAVSKLPVNSLPVIIKVEDYGAVSKLTANIARFKGDTIIIPRDDNDNDIADGAVSSDGVSLDVYSTYIAVPNSDIDNTPAGPETGDGFTNYQEYRGFIRKNSNVPGAIRFYFRTNILKKNIFIISNYYLFPLSYFSNTGLQFYRIIDDSKILYQRGQENLTLIAGFPDGPATNLHAAEINYNRGRHSGGAQYGLFLEKRIMANLFGICEGDMAAAQSRGRFMTPRETFKVLINVNMCHNRIVNGIHLNPSNYERATIAHELGHGINIRHHGDFFMARVIIGAFRVRTIPLPGGGPGATTIQIVSNSSAVIFTGPGNPPFIERYRINGETSGNTNCVMIYDNERGFAGVIGEEVFFDDNDDGFHDPTENNILAYSQLDEDGNQVLDDFGNPITLPYYCRSYEYIPLPHTNNIIPKQYCTSNEGDFHNAAGGTTPIPAIGGGSPANNATMGNCLVQIRIKCW